MTFKTRGSNALDKAQRRLALLKSIDEHLDLGYGLTIDTYSRAIETARTTLEAHNTLLSKVEESRKAVIQMDSSLSSLSERMLSGVATKYGKDSVEYAKAGGTNCKRKQLPIPSQAINSTPATAQPVKNGFQPQPQ
jgi:hypothetical protein